MFKLLNSRRGQNTAEYAILIGVIVAAAIAMQIYIRRGMQARIKDAVDYTKTADDSQETPIFTATQYEPYYMETNFETRQSGRRGEGLTTGGGYFRDVESDVTERAGNQTYTSWDETDEDGVVIE